MSGIEQDGIRGRSFDEVTLPHVAKQEHDAFERTLPKSFPRFPFRMPWTSIGQAPTDENVQDEGRSGSA